MYDIPYETHKLSYDLGKKKSKSKIHIFPIYEQMDPKTAIVNLRQHLFLRKYLNSLKILDS